VLHVDAREADLLGPFDGILTSPPYPGLIDYHEQHRYAYELLELDDRREREIGAAASGTSLGALEAYRNGIAGVLARAAVKLRPGAPILVVVNDRRDLYPDILAPASSSRRGYAGMSTGARAGGRASTSKMSWSRARAEPANRPPRTRVRSCRDRPQACCGSPALPDGRRLDRAGNQPHPGLVDDREHFLGGDGGDLLRRRSRAARLAVVAAER
jgi:hypothetical protein